MNINERLKFLRKEKLKLTQEDFANRINISRANLGSIEVGRINVTDRVIQDVCREFDVNEDWLQTGDGEVFIILSRDEELAKWMGTIMKPSMDKSFPLKFVNMLSKLDESDWKVLEKISLLMFDEKEKD